MQPFAFHARALDFVFCVDFVHSQKGHHVRELGCVDVADDEVGVFFGVDFGLGHDGDDADVFVSRGEVVANSVDVPGLRKGG